MQQPVRTAKQLGQALRRQRRALGLTQQELGRRTRLRQATISGLESGAEGTQLGTLVAALAALGLEIVVQPRIKAGPAEMPDLS